jgi:hypothetical protein
MGNESLPASWNGFMTIRSALLKTQPICGFLGGSREPSVTK